jgi:hypothetical protein
MTVYQLLPPATFSKTAHLHVHHLDRYTWTYVPFYPVSHLLTDWLIASQWFLVWCWQAQWHSSPRSQSDDHVQACPSLPSALLHAFPVFLHAFPTIIPHIPPFPYMSRFPFIHFYVLSLCSLTNYSQIHRHNHPLSPTTKHHRPQCPPSACPQTPYARTRWPLCGMGFGVSFLGIQVVHCGPFPLPLPVEGRRLTQPVMHTQCLLQVLGSSCSIYGGKYTFNDADFTLYE